MKLTTVLLSLFLFITLISCGGETTETAEVEAAPEKQGMTCDALTSQYDEQEGKEITIKAISWGTSNTASGDIYLNLGDEALTGMQQAKVVAVFSADQEAEAKGAAKDAEVTIKATVGESKYGAIYLTNPVIE